MSAVSVQQAQGSAGFTPQVMEFLYANNMAFHYPEPADKNRYIRSKVWTYEYESFMPDVYDWPESKVH